MKKITTILMMLLVATFGFAQQEVVQDFEDSPTVEGFEGLASATIVDDPSSAGNGKVYELVTATGGNPWQGAFVELSSDSSLDLTSDKSIDVDIWSNVAFSPMLKVESSESAAAAANTQSHTGSGWETLTFTFDTGSDNTSTADGTYTKIAFFPNRNAADDNWRNPIIDGTFYFDNIKGVKTSIGFAQQEVVQDFEDSPTVEGFEGLASATIVDDPSSAGNGKVYELVTATGGNPWQGAFVELSSDSSLDLTSDKSIDVDIWSNVAFSPMLKVESSESAAAAANTQSHTGSGWETLTFTFDTGSDNTSTADGTYTKIAFFPNRNAADDNWRNPIIDGTFYFDNIKGVKTSIGTTEPDPEPATAAPTPPARDAADVISIFSDAYSDINVDTFDTTWCPAETKEVIIGGDATKLVTGLGCEGVDFQSGRFDATGMTHFHMDIWTDTDLQDKSFNFKFSDWAGGAGEVGAWEYSATNANILTVGDEGKWISIDLPLSAFTVINGVDGTDFVQFVITSNLGTVYYDNIYLYSNVPLSNTDFAQAEFKAYPNPARAAWTIQTTEDMKAVQVYNIAGSLVRDLEVNASKTVISTEGLSSGVYLAKISNGSDQTKTIKLIKE